MPTLPILNPTGKPSKEKAHLPSLLFAAKVNPQLMAQAVRVYLTNQRQSPAKTKTRGQVKASNRKIWRQKGTGHARHGARSAPIFIKSGVAHGPTGKQNFKLKMSQKMRHAALASALTSKLQSHQVLIVKGLEKLHPQTKTASQILSQLKLANQKTTIVLPSVLDNLILATRNLPQTTTIQANLLNTYTTLNAGTLIFLPDSIAKLKETFLKEKTPTSTKPPKVTPTATKTPKSKTPTKKSPSTLPPAQRKSPAPKSLPSPAKSKTPTKTTKTKS